MSPLPLPPRPPPDLVQHSTWTSMHATAVHVLPGMLRYLGVAEDDIDDLSQEVLLGAYTSLPRYDPASPPPPAPGTPSEPSLPHGLGPRWRAEAAWLFGIAWRQVGHHLERAYRRREVPVGLVDAACFETAGVAPSSEQHIARKERGALATCLLAKIAPERRAVLLLADAYEIPMHEIARALELNENTAASRLRLAREDYRAAVKRLRPEEQQTLRSGLFMLPLFSLTSASSSASVASHPAHSGASAIADTNPPATLASPQSDLGRHDLADPSGDPARSARLARLARLARPLARFLRPALEWGTAGIGGAAMAAALAKAPVPWADHLAPVATQILLARAVHTNAQPATDPGEAPHSGTPRREAISIATREIAISPKETPASAPKEAPASRTLTPSPAPAKGSGQRKPAAPMQQARSDEEQDPLAEELRLLDAARQALLQGDRATAMDRIAAHERRFPQGRLKLLRERLRSKVDARRSAPAGSAATQQELP
ncbi:sigma factor-like helix-turn-helix DNA-binding protein [Sorangium sp. So ce1014]|uniref:RNA polymerase sigma factor n=2 Tax=unclassified Sorangium TaxID=2621164 RepID=UPI003F6429E7